MSTPNLPKLQRSYRVRRRLRFTYSGRHVTGSAVSYVLTQSSGRELCTLAGAVVPHVRALLARMRGRART